MEFITNILAIFGLTPIQALTALYNILMGLVGVWITNGFKKIFAGVPWIGDLMQQKLKGFITPLINGIIGVIFVWLGSLILGLTYESAQTFWTTIGAGFALNQTVGQVYFEYLKYKKEKITNQ